MWNDTEYESSALSRVASATRTVTLPRPRAFGTSTRSEYVPRGLERRGDATRKVWRRDRHDDGVRPVLIHGRGPGLPTSAPPGPRGRPRSQTRRPSLSLERRGTLGPTPARRTTPALATMLFPACTCDGHAFIGSYGEFKTLVRVHHAVHGRDDQIVLSVAGEVVEERHRVRRLPDVQHVVRTRARRR